MPEPAAPRRLAEIQVLRAVAVAMVLFEHIHANLLEWHSPLQTFSARYWCGDTGFDLALVITGFVVARSLLPRLQAARDGDSRVAVVANFLLRRFWRLQPAALLWLALPLLVVTSTHFGALQALWPNLSGAFAGALGITNLRAIRMPPGFPPSLFFPFWSLSLGTQFSIVLPLMAIAAGSWLPRLLLLAALAQFMLPPDPVLAYTRPGALSCGVLLAIWAQADGYRLAQPVFLARNSAARGAFLLGLVALLGGVASAMFADVSWLRPGMAEVIGAALVYAASFDAGYVVRPGRLQQILAGIGDRSYALYLVHIPAYALARALVGHMHQTSSIHGKPAVATLLAAGFVLTGVLAEATFRLVEQPCRRHAKTLRLEPETGPQALRPVRA